ncbi:MAG: glycosyltransferase family 2 protein [Cyclobacteriaceae bacterium]|nr:glycosyltransferase family 2 protein [Cyclobacteriaceae bacterium]
MGPLVTIICIVYNHEKTVAECVKSVRTQTYKNIELLLIDDGSSDNSKKILLQLKEAYDLKLILHATNYGYCKTFNEGLAFATGKYILDLSADDLLHPDFVSISVRKLEDAPIEYAAHYTDAWLVNNETKETKLHSQTTRFTDRPSGDVYQKLIQHYFICSPTVLFKRDYLLQVKGYDETLLYEDFDIQIRLARLFKFCYTALPLVTKTVSHSNMSKKQNMWHSAYQRSTYLVCKKIYSLNRNRKENIALAKRCVYESKNNFLIGNWKLTLSYLALSVKSYFTY